MAPDVDPDADVDISLAGTDAVPCISAGCELELAESDGAPDFDGMPDFQRDLNLEQLPVYLQALHFSHN